MMALPWNWTGSKPWSRTSSQPTPAAQLRLLLHVLERAARHAPSEAWSGRGDGRRQACQRHVSLRRLCVEGRRAAEVAAALEELSVQPVPDDLRESPAALRAHSALISGKPAARGRNPRPPALDRESPEQARSLQDPSLSSSAAPRSLALTFACSSISRHSWLLIYLSRLYGGCAPMPVP